MIPKRNILETDVCLWCHLRLNILGLFRIKCVLFKVTCTQNTYIHEDIFTWVRGSHLELDNLHMENENTAQKLTVLMY